MMPPTWAAQSALVLHRLDTLDARVSELSAAVEAVRTDVASMRSELGVFAARRAYRSQVMTAIVGAVSGVIGAALAVVAAAL